MGASGWKYFTPYREDPDQALDELKRDVFRRGEYFSLLAAGNPSYEPASIEQLLEDNEEEGTHSILDMVGGCAEVPSGDFMQDFGKVIAVSAEDRLRILGTDKPTRAAVEAKALELMDLRSRWIGSYLTVYDDDGHPSELYFTGFSGD